MSASVSHIADGLTLGPGQSFIGVEHRVPDGCQVIELALCENCARRFVRSRCYHPQEKPCGCIKFCGMCRENCFIVSREKTEEILEALSPIKTIKTRNPHKAWHSDWQSRLIQKLSELGALSAYEIREVVGSGQLDASSMLGWMKVNHGIVFETVACVWPRTQRKGNPRMLYAIADWRNS